YKTQLAARKAHTFARSIKNWPVGILPAVKYRRSYDTITMCEGDPDYLSLIHFSLRQKRAKILPVAIPGRGACVHGLHPEALDHFRGRRVRILPHDDPDGGSYKNALLWAKQLAKLDREVDFFTLRGLRKANGKHVKDLNDCVEVASDQISKLEGLFP